MMVSLQEKHNFELTADEYKGWVSKEEDRVVAALNAKCRECEGCSEELEKLATSKKYHLAIVSSSAYQRIFAAIRKVGHEKYFEPEHIYSASSSLPKPTFKPDPAIYLWAMEKLGKNPEECVAIEDSGSGANSAVRAGVSFIGYVGSYHGAEKQAEMKKMLEEVGAKAVMTHWRQFPDCLAKIEAS
jgi:beta-phosphoglucomutase-like phosphatase (HAD superfamily)